MAHYVLPVPGDFYVFPAWQPHSVPPFRGEGERWSLAFNVVAVPQPSGSAPLPPAAAGQVAPPGPQLPLAPPANASLGRSENVSLSSRRARPGGF
jgi:hypothetical protein